MIAADQIVTHPHKALARGRRPHLDGGVLTAAYQRSQRRAAYSLRNPRRNGRVDGGRITYEAIGIASSKTEPSESDLAMRSTPPCLSTSVRQIASPKPIPEGLVLKKASNMRSQCSLGTPPPESCTKKTIEVFTILVPSCNTLGLYQRPRLVTREGFPGSG